MSVSHSACQDCGACCASFRVSFYWAEADDGGGTVPAGLTERRDAFHRCMRGTWSATPRCIALQGEIGRQVGCSIYPLRSSACRELHAGSPQCHRARQHWGLPPLASAAGSQAA